MLAAAAAAATAATAAAAAATAATAATATAAVAAPRVSDQRSDVSLSASNRRKPRGRAYVGGKRMKLAQ